MLFYRCTTVWIQLMLVKKITLLSPTPRLKNLTFSGQSFKHQPSCLGEPKVTVLTLILGQPSPSTHFFFWHRGDYGYGNPVKNVNIARSVVKQTARRQTHTIWCPLSPQQQQQQWQQQHQWGYMFLRMGIVNCLRICLTDLMLCTMLHSKTKTERHFSCHIKMFPWFTTVFFFFSFVPNVWR